jgi:hypothetical protein
MTVGVDSAMLWRQYFLAEVRLAGVRRRAMSRAIFFHYGFAIHGANDISHLGDSALHGDVKLHPAIAATLFALVARSRPRNTRIEIRTGSC